MSFADYGFEVFPFGPHRNRPNVLQSCGDCLSISSRHFYWNPPLDNSCYHVIIDHLIDLGTCTENELVLVREELEKYKRLKLTEEQIELLRRLDAECKHEEIERFARNSKLEGSNLLFSAEDSNQNHDCSSRILTETSDSNIWNVPRISSLESEIDTNDRNCCKDVSPRQVGTHCACQSPAGNWIGQRKSQLTMSDATFRTTIIQKDSEIISLKNEKAVKETEVKEVEEQNRKLEVIMEKMRDNIEILESGARISQAQMQNVVQQKNEELELLRQNIEKLEHELTDDRQTRILHEQEIRKLQALVREIQTLRKNLAGELKVMNRRVEALESSNTSQATMVKQLQQERANLDKQNSEQENEIGKLLSIIKRLNEKFDRSKAELSSSREELEASERRVAQCREQLESVEREVSSLIADLADCLGRTDCSPEATATSPEKNMYVRARELTRGLSRLVREHEKCHAHRVDLLREIDRLGAINRAHGIARPIAAIEDVKKDANREIARLKRVVLGADNYHAIKTDLKNIVDDLLTRIDARRIERNERAYLEVASEASLALEKLDRKINDHDVYRRCESFLLLELENLQNALDGAEKTINGLDSNRSIAVLDMNSTQNAFEAKGKEFLEGNDNYSIIESILSKKILQRVQSSTQIVIRITTALRDDSNLKMTYNKNLENQLQQALLVLNEIGVEKCQLQCEYDACEKKSRELAVEVEKLRVALTEKSSELQCLKETTQARFDSYQKENDALRNQIISAEKKFQDSRAENAALIKKSDEMIDTLQREKQTKDYTLLEYGKFNDMLNGKLEEANRTIEQLQSTIVQERMRKVDLDSFTSLHDRILELVGEKDELLEKIAVMESQLASYERNNDRLQSNLAKILEDNEQLEWGISQFKCENDLLESNIVTRDTDKVNVGSKCDELLGKIEKIVKCSKQCQKRGSANVSDSIIRGLEKDIKSQKDKLCYQKKELMVKEKEVLDMKKIVVSLHDQIDKTKDENSMDSLATLQKRIEILTREKSELKNELKQTLAKYEDKLAEMHKQYKQNEIELHKNHNDSIRRLEAKYMEMMTEEGKIFNSQNWLQSLNSSELQELHDRICKTPLCANSTYEKDLYEEQKKKNLNKNAVSNYAIKKPLQSKKDVRNIKNSSSNVVKTSSRQRISARETLSNHSIVIPEKDYSHRMSSVNVAVSRNK